MESLERFALDNTTEGVLLLDGFSISWANKSIERILKMPKEDLIGKHFSALHFRDIQMVEKKLKELEENRDKELVEMVFDVTTVGRLLFRFHFPKEGKGACCFVKQEELYSQEQQLAYYKQADELSGIYWAFFEIDFTRGDSRRLFLSKYAVENPIWRGKALCASDLVGPWVREKYDWKDSSLQWWDAQFRELAQGGQGYKQIENKVVFPDKSEKYIRTSAHCLGNKGQLYQFFHIAIDVTAEKLLLAELEKKQIEFDQMLEGREMLTKFFDHSPVLMATVEIVDDEQDVAIVIMNPAMKNKYKLSHLTSIQGLRFHSDLGLSQSEMKKWIGIYQDVARKQEPLSLDYFFGPTVYSSCCVLQLGENRFAVIAQDLSSLRKMEEELLKSREELGQTVQERTRELKQALQVKSRFLAIMSHEIRTPLSGVIGSLNLLSETTLSKKQKELVRIGEVCGEQLLVVINDILDLSKMEENKMLIERSSFNIRTTLEESLEVVSFAAANKSLELICEVDQSVPEVVIGDASRLRQVLVNLLGNSIKFSNTGNIILRVSCSTFNKEDCQIDFSVQDEGIGISKDYQHLIFQPFVQADSSTRRQHGGTGLGLSISKRLSELMGGTMNFCSTEGVGSTFCFHIRAPVVSDDTNNSVDVPLHKSAGMRVAVAAPNSAVGTFIKKQLELFQFTCSLLSTAESVVGFLDSNQEVDLFMFDTTFGTDLLNTIKERHYPIALINFANSAEDTIPSIKKPLTECKLRDFIIEYFKWKVPCEQDKKKSKVDGRLPTDNNILIVEDNLLNQQIIKKMLSSFGFKNIDVASNGKVAVAAVQQKDYWIVFMDVMMPVMNGIEATKCIVNSEAIKNKPVIIALTANAFQEDREQYLSVGMNAVLTKPIDKEELLETLRKAACFDLK